MKRVLYLLAGAIIGLVFVSGGMLGTGVLVGVGVAYILYEQRMLARRVSGLERDLDSVNRHAEQASDELTAESSPEMERQPGPDAEQGPEPAIVELADNGPAPAQQVGSLQPDGYRPQTASLPGALPPLPDDAEPGTLELLAGKLRDWITTGNVPVKVGVIVSFFGVAFLLKYAVDQNLLSMPMWLRLVFAALFGLVLLIVGWRLRSRMRVYALSLQGGGVGVIYLTVFAAFRLYGLLPPVPAFLLLALITIPTALLAVSQNARAMAVLAVTGGFLAPVLASTGEGSHVALFSYYLLLNVMIVGIAWFKSWRELNLIGFLFTFVIGTAWGYQYYRPEYLASTEPFLIAHFLLYQVAAILFAFRQPPRLRGIVDGALIFGAPVVAFGLQAALLDDTEYGLAYSAIALAAFYGVTAWWLSGRDKTMTLLRNSFVVLGVAFATVAVPLFLNASWTAATWAMEGAALVWLSVKQSNLLSRFAGIALIVMAGAAFIVGGWDNDAGVPVLNGNVLGGVLLSLAGFFSAWNLGQVEHRYGRWASIGLLVWGMGWWFITGTTEIDDRLGFALEYPVTVAFLAASGAVLSYFGRLLDWKLARYGSLAMLPILAAILFGRGIDGKNPFESYAAMSWLLAGIAHLYILKPLPANSGPAPIWHGGGVLCAAWLFAAEIDWWVVVDTWGNTAISFMLSLLAAFCLWGARLFSWPLQAERYAYVTTAGILLGLNLLFILGFSVESPGDPLPLVYLPVLNPYSLATVAALALGYFWISTIAPVAALNAGQKRTWLYVLAAAVFALSTIAVVRGVHHYADVPWRQYALGRSVLVQAALSIYWGLVGFAAMVWGARREMRWLWLTGSGLMTLVVIKLFLVDLGNSATVARIVSFIGVGALLLVVGYFAPVPPRDAGSVKKES